MCIALCSVIWVKQTHTDRTIDNSWRKHPAKNRSVNPDWTLTCSLFQPAAQNQWLLKLAMWCAATRQHRACFEQKNPQKFWLPPCLLGNIFWKWTSLSVNLIIWIPQWVCRPQNLCYSKGTEKPGWYINIVPDELFQHIESRITISFPCCSLIH